MLQRALSHTHHLRARLANRRLCRRRKFLNLNRRACHASQFPHAKFNFTTTRTACASAWRVLHACCSRAPSSQSWSIPFASRTQQAVNFSSTTVFVRIQLLHDLSTRPATCTRTCCIVCCSVCCSVLLQCVLQCVLKPAARDLPLVHKPVVVCVVAVRVAVCCCSVRCSVLRVAQHLHTLSTCCSVCCCSACCSVLLKCVLQWFSCSPAPLSTWNSTCTRTRSSKKILQSRNLQHRMITELTFEKWWQCTNLEREP